MVGIEVIPNDLQALIDAGITIEIKKTDKRDTFLGVIPRGILVHEQLDVLHVGGVGVSAKRRLEFAGLLN